MRALRLIGATVDLEDQVTELLESFESVIESLGRLAAQLFDRVREIDDALLHDEHNLGQRGQLAESRVRVTDLCFETAETSFDGVVHWRALRVVEPPV